MTLQQAIAASFIVSPDNEWFRMDAVDGTDVYYHDEDTGMEYRNNIEEMADWTAKVVVDAP